MSGAPRSSRATTAVILNETRSGWAWTVPDGALVPSSQDWSLDDRTDPDSVPSEEQLTVLIDPKPPIAEPDAFGVRAGSLVSLPVLMNDHDPNEDVLSIDPASVTGLDPGFGTATITDNGQRLTVRVAPDASGRGDVRRTPSRTARAQGGLLSDQTVVQLTVAAEQHRAGMVRSRAVPGRMARTGGGARRDGDRPGAAGMGRPGGRSAAAARRRQSLGGRQRGVDPRRRRRLPAQR